MTMCPGGGTRQDRIERTPEVGAARTETDNDMSVLLEFAIAVTATVAPIVIIVRLIAGPDTDDGAGIAAGAVYRQRDLSWPRGVQEEEPVRWTFKQREPAQEQRSPTQVAPRPTPAQAARQTAAT